MIQENFRPKSHKSFPCTHSGSGCNQARSQDQIWGGADPQNVDLLEPYSLNPPTNTLFLVHFVTERDVLEDLG